MGNAKTYYWIAIGQIIGLVTMIGLRLKLDSVDAVLLMALSVCVLCIFIAKGAGAILGVFARSITGMIVGAITGGGLGLISGIIADQFTGTFNACIAYAMVGVVAGVFVGLILNATANNGIDKTVDAIVAGITIGAVVGLIYFRTDGSFYGYIVSLIAGMTLGAVVSMIAGAVVSVIGFRITDVIVDAILCDMETRNTLVGTPITAIPLIIILISAIIGCILSIWANARQKRSETRHTTISTHT